MRMTAFLMIVTCLHIAAKGVSQVVSIKAKDRPLREVFMEMSKQTGVSILYKEKELQHAKPVSVDVKNVPLQQLLSDVLKDQQLEYRTRNGIIFIEPQVIPENMANIKSPVADTPKIDVYGVVLNEVTQQPIDGVTVFVKGTKRGAVTVNGGSYSLKAVPENATLIVSSLGYIPQEILVAPVKNGAGNTVIIRLRPYVSQLDETVIQAYGTTTKRKTTGDIVTVRGEDLAKQPIMDPLLAMQGRVNGLEITQQSGSPIGAVKVELRGRKSINQNFSSNPLYIIDGVPLTVLDVNKNLTAMNASSGNVISAGFDQTGLSNTFGINPLSAINPADIGSIEVLKDADATAIYGSRGANGVILITTKKGKSGPNKFNVSVRQGISFVTGRWDLLNTPQYVAMRREAYKNDGITPSAAAATTGYAPDIMIWDTTRYTDWQKYFWNNLGKVTNAQAEMSGGSDLVTYRFGGGYNRSTDLTRLSGATTRATAALSIGTQSRNQRFKTSLSATYAVINVDALQSSGSAIIPPNSPPLFDSLGHLNFAEYRISNVPIPNSNIYNIASTQSNLLTGSFMFSYNVVKGLEIRSTFGYNSNRSDSRGSFTLKSQDPLTASATATANFGNSSNLNWQIEPQVEYNVSMGKKGRVNVLAGATLQDNITKATTLTGLGYKSDVLLSSINNAPVIVAKDASGEYKYAGMFGRIGYSWDDKYIVNLNARRDGSSRFGLGNQFGNFGSVGAAWILSDEHWIRQWLPVLVSFVKLRGSYGITGSDQIGDYQYLTQWGVTNNGNLPAPLYNGVTPLIPQIQANPNFHWQATKKLEAAVNVALLDDRISFEIARYQERCNNQLIAYPTPVITGFMSVVQNSPASVQNSGWEFSFNARAVERTDFSWNTRLNLSGNRNVLKAFPMLEKSPYFSAYKIGDPITATYLLHNTGVDPNTGMYTYEDYNHDGQVAQDGRFAPGTGGDDRYVKVNLTPALQGGFGNTFRYRNISISADFVYVKQRARQSLVTANPGTYENITVWAYEHRWQYPGQQNALTPKLSTIQNDKNFGASDLVYTDASYLRLNTVALSYSMPAKLQHMLRVSSFAANVSAQNLFVITPYKGMDPAITTFGTIPPARIITAGFSCGF